MEDNRPRYEATCPVCGKIMYVCLSIGQQMGMLSVGGGNCIGCNERLNFTFNPDELSMTATEWVKWKESQEVK